MMKAKNLIFLAVLILSITSCYQDQGFESDQFIDEQYEEEGEDPFGDGPLDESDGSLTLYKVQGDDLSKIKDFEVSGSLKSFQEDYGKHLEMWDFTKRLVPAGERIRIAEFMVFHGGDDLAGYVEPINENDLSEWRFGLAIEIAENLEEINFQDFFTYVTIHELGHIVTLNETQLDVTVDEDLCNNYFPGEGCAKTNAYINGIYELGWKDIIHELESNNDIYQKYPDRFSTDYAASNPGEDIAEVFAIFITKADAPTGNTIADQKIKMMYDYPELVALRDQMRESPALRAMQPGSWQTNPLIKQFRLGGCKKHCKSHASMH